MTVRKSSGGSPKSETASETASAEAPALLPVLVDDVVPVEVGPGCFRRDLPSTRGIRVWVVDIKPGSEWPYDDVHDGGSDSYTTRHILENI